MSQIMQKLIQEVILYVLIKPKQEFLLVFLKHTVDLLVIGARASTKTTTLNRNEQRK